MYLTTLLFIFIASLVKGKFLLLDIWIERIYLFFSIAAFSLSFQLPSSLMNLHKERIEHEIESRHPSNERRTKQSRNSDTDQCSS